MGSRTGFIIFLLLVISYTNADARALETMDIIATTKDSKQPSKISEKEISRNKQLCTLCEEYTSNAISFLSENETQTQIINTLHGACSRMHSFKKQCTLLVDYYVPLFFVEIATIRPEQFCEKVNLCEEMSLVHQLKPDDTCTVCHQVVVQILLKLKDPDTQLGIIELLLKGCNKAGSFAQEELKFALTSLLLEDMLPETVPNGYNICKCKKLVFQYGPLILVNLESFLEKTDVCVAIHACKATQLASERQGLSADS